MKIRTCFFLASALFSTTVYSANSAAVDKCLQDFPDADFNAQLDCLDPILAKASTQLDEALKARISSLGGDKKAIKVLEKQQKDWTKKLNKSICPETGRIQEAAYVAACKIDATNKRTAEISK
jgi:uncharacterized protein YecT (DUF1311 family)